MTDDIAALISSLKYSCHKVITSAEDKGKLVELLAVQITRGNLEIVIDALSRFTTAPLPDEITDFLNRLVSGDTSPEQKTVGAAMITAALRAQAQEIANLRTEHDNINAAVTNIVTERDAQAQEIARLQYRTDKWNELESRLAQARERISKLEAERDNHRDVAFSRGLEIRKLIDERDEIRRKTLEECAALLDRIRGTPVDGQIKAICALAQAEPS